MEMMENLVLVDKSRDTPEYSDAVKLAVLSLLEDKDPAYKRDALSALLQMNRFYPVRFVGALTELNVLINMALTDPSGYEAVKAIVDARRFAQHKPMMFPPEEMRRERNLTQRDLMRQRRSRTSFALRIENALRAQRPGAVLLTGNARTEFETKVMQKWGKQLKQRIDQARGRDNVRLTRETLNNISNQFWEEIQCELQNQWDAIVNSHAVTA
jgi:hypothetical protein